jgi:hypothetical protein
VCALDRLDEEVHLPPLLLERRVLRVGERARRPQAQARQVVLVLAEVLTVHPHLEGAKVLVDHLPHNLVTLHLRVCELVVGF